MNLFSKEVDKAVNSPNVSEWERIEKQLRKDVTAAKRTGNAEELKWALEDYAKHQQKRAAYVEAGQKQLSIFDF